jgi:putative oxygen-independent coproporphyrinogen III oxidase
VETIFIGGGTPSLVDPDYIARLLEVCSKRLELDSNIEISMESNPGTLTPEGLKRYKAAGVNRLSIGLQAWQDRLLESMGRIHRIRQFVDNFNAACEAGFENINADLIFGLPGQAFEDWEETLEAVLALSGNSHRLTHLSCYSLSIEEKTVFGEMRKAGKLDEADDLLDRRMYRHAVETLADKGFRHYEISNFALPGFECRHNLIYWRAMEYAGFGAGAHSFLDGVRFSNKADIGQYIDAVNRLASASNAEKGDGTAEHRGSKHRGAVPPCQGCQGDGSLDTNADACQENRPPDTDRRTVPLSVPLSAEKPSPCVLWDRVPVPLSLGGEPGLFEDIRVIGRREAMSEFMILGLRLTDGISPDEFEERFGASLQTEYGDKLEKLVGKGLIECVNHGGIRYRLTRRGLDFANEAFMEFI